MPSSLVYAHAFTFNLAVACKLSAANATDENCNANFERALKLGSLAKSYKSIRNNNAKTHDSNDVSKNSSFHD